MCKRFQDSPPAEPGNRARDHDDADHANYRGDPTDRRFRHLLHVRDRARSRCYFQVLMADGLDHWGRYVDELVRVDGEWRFARRRVSVDGRRADSPFR